MNNTKNSHSYCVQFYISILLISISIVSSIGVWKNKSFYFEGYIYNNYLAKPLDEYCGDVQRFLDDGMTDEEKEFFQSRTHGIYYYLTDEDTKLIFTNIPNGTDNTVFSTQSNIMSMHYSKQGNLVGEVFIDKNMGTMEQSLLHLNIESGFNLQKTLYIESSILVISLFFGSILLINSYKRAIEDILRQAEFIPIDVKLLIMVVAIMGWAFLLDTYLRRLITFSVLRLRIILSCVFVVLIFIILILIFMLVLKAQQYTTGHAMFKQEWENRLTKNTPVWFIGLFFQLVWYFIVLVAFLPEPTMYDYTKMIRNNITSIIAHNFIIVIVFLLIRQIQKNKAQYIKKVLYVTKEIANGNFEQHVPVVGNDGYAQISNNINTIKEGYIHALNEQKRSERLKYELVTNISHDLRTPLTSVLNYIELAKRNGTSKEEIEKYIDNAEINAKRLNILIEDLFELSKMESGNMHLNIVPIDIVLLLKQIMHEYKEQLQQNNLEPILDCMNQHVIWKCDSLKMWRLFDNLIYNAVKYSLPGTRIYVAIEQKNDNGSIIIRVKNISNYKMNFEPEELFLRFKRGDEARETEGSGLGLAISKSIVMLHNGNIHIETEGDMFKVIVRLNE
jgi:signal transduction histidine kinase